MVKQTQLTPAVKPDEATPPIASPARERRSLRDLWSVGILVVKTAWHLRKVSRLGKYVRMTGKPVLLNLGTMNIGDRVRLASHIVPLELYAGPGALLEIGENSFINHGCSIAATQRIVIGPSCSIGPYSIIMDNDWHRLEPERRQETPPSAPVVLEENVWLGARVTVLRGVTIGAGSVVGVGSLVTTDIPPRSLAVGSPARVIRQL